MTKPKVSGELYKNAWTNVGTKERLQQLNEQENS